MVSKLRHSGRTRRPPKKMVVLGTSERGVAAVVWVQRVTAEGRVSCVARADAAKWAARC